MSSPAGGFSPVRVERWVGQLATTEMNMIIFSVLAIILAVFALYIAIRNTWVFNRRTELNRFDGDVHVITQYVDYYTMMYKFWIWDIEKLKVSNIK